MIPRAIGSRSTCVVGVVLSIAVCLAAQAAAQPGESSSGLILALDGDVLVTRHAGELTPAEGFVLQDGDTLWVKQGARCKGFTPEGETFTLNGPAQLVFSSPRGRPHGSGVTGWIAEVVSQWVGESRRRPLTTRSVRSWETPQDACSPIAPAADGRVRAGSASFYWTTIPGIDRYEVAIAPATGAEIVHTVRGHSLVLNDLAPGAEYVWRVTPVIPQADLQGRWNAFRVMTPEEERSLESALEGKTDLEAGVLLLSAGLNDEAVYRLDAAANGGTDRRSVLRWRAEALSAMGQYAAAYADLLETMTKP
jgi:hypothetical protein